MKADRSNSRVPDEQFLRQLLRDYGLSGLVACLREMALEAGPDAEPDRFMAADQQGYLAWRLSTPDFIAMVNSERELIEKLEALPRELSRIAVDLNQLHAEFLGMEQRVKALLQSVSTNFLTPNIMGEKWGDTDCDSDQLKTRLQDFLADVLERADLPPRTFHFSPYWVLLPGRYMALTALANQVPEFRAKLNNVLALMTEREQMLRNQKEMGERRISATKNISEYLTRLKAVIDAVPLDEIERRLSHNGN